MKTSTSYYTLELSKHCLLGHLINVTTRLLGHLVNVTTRSLGHLVNGIARLLGYLVNRTTRFIRPHLRGPDFQTSTKFHVEKNGYSDIPLIRTIGALS